MTPVLELALKLGLPRAKLRSLAGSTVIRKHSLLLSLLLTYLQESRSYSLKTGLPGTSAVYFSHI